MSASRRRLLLMSLSASGSVLLGFGRSGAQDPTPPARPPRVPSDAAEDSENPANVRPNGAKAILEQRQKDIKKQIEKLDATVVLSLAMVRKADEIEKLAKHIKENAKG